MTGLPEVLGGVLMGAGITTADVTAGKTHPQVSPAFVLVELPALFALAGRSGLRFLDLDRQVRAGRWSRLRLS